MPKLIVSNAMSLDGYYTGPDDTPGSPPQAACVRRSGAPRSDSAWTCPGCTAMTAGTAPTSA
jgi:hypothetical protein